MYRVLLAEDHPELRRQLKRALVRHRLAFVVEDVATTDAALELLPRPFDFHLLDMCMPGPPGGAFHIMSAAREAKAKPRKTVVISGHFDAPTTARAGREGAEILMKPADVEDIVETFFRRVPADYSNEKMAEVLYEREEPLKEVEAIKERLKQMAQRDFKTTAKQARRLGTLRQTLAYQKGKK